MELKNPLYKNIGIHVVSNIFTVDKGVTKVLLIKRTNNPYINGFLSGLFETNSLTFLAIVENK